MDRDPFEPDPSVEAPAFVELDPPTRADTLAADLWGGFLLLLLVAGFPIVGPIWFLGRLSRKLRRKLWEDP